jgi:hypothetical protein
VSHDPNRVFKHRLIDDHSPRCGLQRFDILSSKNQREPIYVEVAPRPTPRYCVDELRFAVAIGIVDFNFHQEANKFGFGQGICAFLLDGVLSRQHHERTLRAVRLAIQRHQSFLHDFE